MTTSRRTVLRGAAWSAPVVATATTAPAVAASECTPVPVTVDWESAHYTRVSDTYGFYEIPLSDGSTLRMEVNTSFVNMNPGGNPPTDGQGTSNDNLRLSQFVIGGTDEPGLVLHQNNYGCAPGGYQDVTFTFDRTISTIDFQVTDIDAVVHDFCDAVGFSTNLSTTPSNTLTGQQLADGRWWYQSAQTGDAPNSDGTHNVRAHGEKLTRFTVTYENWDNADNNTMDRDQRVFLTDFAITVPPVGC
ncbi:hypothetical protein [Kytococcus schroeteri]|uniref:hypothetical protein n=1 Tax=Kytococcus schroeteri TaxID=138300 RepID=UPI0011819B36|nr:hypothetical protein [Kytococcus schroeteri]